MVVRTDLYGLLLCTAGFLLPIALRRRALAGEEGL